MIDMTAEQIKLWCEENWKGPLINSQKTNIFEFKKIYTSGSYTGFSQIPVVRKRKRKN